MAEKVLTLEAVKEHFCTADKRASLEAIRKRLDEALDIEAAAQLMIDIGEGMEKQIKENGLDWTPGDRILWTVKEAFIWGCLDMASKFMVAADLGYEDLAGEGAEA